MMVNLYVSSSRPTSVSSQVMVNLCVTSSRPNSVSSQVRVNLYVTSSRPTLVGSALQMGLNALTEMSARHRLIRDKGSARPQEWWT